MPLFLSLSLSSCLPSSFSLPSYLSLLHTQRCMHIPGNPPALLWCTLTACPAACLEQSHSSDNVLFSLWTFAHKCSQIFNFSFFTLFSMALPLQSAHPYHTHIQTQFLDPLMLFISSYWQCLLEKSPGEMKNTQHAIAETHMNQEKAIMCYTILPTQCLTLRLTG